MAKKGQASDRFARHIAEAQKSVATMPEGRLKEIAFERILNHLLENQSGPKTSNTKELKPRSGSHRPEAKTKVKQPSGPLGWLNEMVDEGFFKTPKSSTQIIEELENRSHHLAPTDITRPLQRLCHDKLLRRKRQAVKDGGRPFLHWVNW